MSVRQAVKGKVVLVGLAVVLVFQMAVAVVGGALFLGFDAFAQYNRQETMRTLIRKGLVDVDRANALLEQQGATLRITGDVDFDGSPKDDYAAFAIHVFGPPSGGEAASVLGVLSVIPIGLSLLAIVLCGFLWCFGSGWIYRSDSLTVRGE